jgi:hypothetical protein
MFYVTFESVPNPNIMSMSAVWSRFVPQVEFGHGVDLYPV